MSKQIQIDYRTIKQPTIIKVDKVKYPITPHNIRVVRKYWDTGDESYLDDLSTVAIVF